MPFRILERKGRVIRCLHHVASLQHGLILHLLHMRVPQYFPFLFPKQLEHMNRRKDIALYNKNQASTDSYLICIPYLTNHKTSFHRLCSSNAKKPSHLLKPISRAAFQHSNSHCLNASPRTLWHFPSKLLSSRTCARSFILSLSSWLTRKWTVLRTPGRKGTNWTGL